MSRVSTRSPPPATHVYSRRDEGKVSDSFGPPDDSQRASHYLHAGQCFCSGAPTSVTTILGSGVAVCLWEAELEIGGINHFLMPDRVGRGRLSSCFGDSSITRLLENLVSLGCGVEDLEAKLFGGVSVMSSPGGGQGLLGECNVGLARSLLEEEGIPIVVADTGGVQGRKLVFQTDDGASWVKRL